MAGGSSEQTAVDEELERVLVGEFDVVELWTLLDEASLQPPPQRYAGESPRGAREIEGVLVVLGRERVQSVSTVPNEVVSLGRGDEERVEPIAFQYRAEGMDAGTAVGPHGTEERQADPELIEQRSGSVGEVGPLRRERTPADGRHVHAPIGCHTVLDSVKAVIS